MEQLPTSRILLVEEDDIRSDNLLASLQKAGAVVSGPVRSVRAALLTLRTERISAVIFAASLERGLGAEELGAFLAEQHMPSLVIDWSPICSPKTRIAGEQLAWPFSHLTFIAAVYRVVTEMPAELAG